MSKYVPERSVGAIYDVNANLKMSIFAETECHFSAVSVEGYTALIHNLTCRLEARQALIYQLVLGLTGENGKYNYSRAVHLYPPFFDITCSAKNYKIAPALTSDISDDFELPNTPETALLQQADDIPVQLPPPDRGSGEPLKTGKQSGELAEKETAPLQPSDNSPGQPTAPDRCGGELPKTGRQSGKLAADTPQRSVQNRRSGRQLQFQRGDETPAVPDVQAAVRKRQMAEFAADQPDDTKTRDNVPQESEPVPLRSGNDVPVQDQPPGESVQPPANHRPNREQPQSQQERGTSPAAPPSGDDTPNHSSGRSGGRLRFEAEPSAAQSQTPGKPKRQQLRFEDTPKPDAVVDTGPSRRQQKQVEKAQRRVDQAEHKLVKAQADLPTKRRAHLDRQYDGDTGKIRRRLRFEKEVIPEGTRPALPIRAGQSALRTAKSTVVWKAHGKVRESERENVAVEAAHKGELAAERGAGRLIRWNKSRLRSKPYRAVRRAERRVTQESARLAWRTALRDTPGLQNKHAFAQWMQKRKLKRKYAKAAKAAREAQKNVQRAHKVINTIDKVGQTIVHLVTHSKSILLVAGLMLFIITSANKDRKAPGGGRSWTRAADDAAICA